MSHYPLFIKYPQKINFKLNVKKYFLSVDIKSRPIYMGEGPQDQ